MIHVKTGEYYGPFDVLLDLIEKEKMDIYDIQISEITNAYIDQINSMEIPSEELTDFIIIAASLLYIKTQTIIKDQIVIEEEEEELNQEELVRRLIEYRRVKALTLDLRKYEKQGLFKHTKHQEDLTAFIPEAEDIVYDISVLKTNLEKLIYKMQVQNEFLVEKILNIDEYSLEEYNKKIKQDIIDKKMINISSRLKRASNKSEVIIIFLSILELSKQKHLRIEQDASNLEIRIILNEDSNESI